MSSSLKLIFLPSQQDDWTWLLKIPVREGEPTPMEFLFLWHAKTLMPMLAKLQEQPHLIGPPGGVA